MRDENFQYTFDPRSLKIISVSIISPNCYNKDLKIIFELILLITSNIALKSSSRKRNGIFDTCKRFCVAVELFVDDDEPLGVIVLVDCGEWDDEEFDWP